MKLKKFMSALCCMLLFFLIWFFQGCRSRTFFTFPGLPEPPIFYISGSASYSSLSPRPRRPPPRPRTILLLLLKAFLTKRSEYIF